MIQSTRLMIYVNDVEVNKDFWLQNFNAQLREEISLPENYQAYIIEMMDSFELALFPLDFIKK